LITPVCVKKAKDQEKLEKAERGAMGLRAVQFAEVWLFLLDADFRLNSKICVLQTLRTLEGPPLHVVIACSTNGISRRTSKAS